MRRMTVSPGTARLLKEHRARGEAVSDSEAEFLSRGGLMSESTPTAPREAEQSWRKGPPGWAYEMVSDPDVPEPDMFPATDNYNADRKRIAEAHGCDYIEVRMETVYLVWDAEEAEAMWREAGCECEDGPHYPAPTYDRSTGARHEPEECATTRPAEDLSDFWDENGIYCPWHPAKRSTPGAVKFRKGVLPR